MAAGQLLQTFARSWFFSGRVRTFFPVAGNRWRQSRSFNCTHHSSQPWWRRQSHELRERADCVPRSNSRRFRSPTRSPTIRQPPNSHAHSTSCSNPFGQELRHVRPVRAADVGQIAARLLSVNWKKILVSAVVQAPSWMHVLGIRRGRGMAGTVPSIMHGRPCEDRAWTWCPLASYPTGKGHDRLNKRSSTWAESRMSAFGRFRQKATMPHTIRFRHSIRW